MYIRVIIAMEIIRLISVGGTNPDSIPEIENSSHIPWTPLATTSSGLFPSTRVPIDFFFHPEKAKPVTRYYQQDCEVIGALLSLSMLNELMPSAINQGDHDYQLSNNQIETSYPIP